MENKAASDPTEQVCQYATEKFKELFEPVKNNPRNTVSVIISVAIVVNPSLVTVPIPALRLSHGEPVPSTY